MRYAKPSYIEFFSYYLQQCLLIDLFSYRAPVHGQKGHLNKVRPSYFLGVFLELAIQFFMELNMALGIHVVLSVRARFSGINVLLPKRGKQAKSRVLGMYRKVFFSQFFNFFSICSIMKIYITVIAVCLKKFHIFENSGS